MALDALLGMSLYKVPACPPATLGCSLPRRKCSNIAVLMPKKLSMQLRSNEEAQHLAGTSKQN